MSTEPCLIDLNAPDAVGEVLKKAGLIYTEKEFEKRRRLGTLMTVRYMYFVWQASHVSVTETLTFHESLTTLTCARRYRVARLATMARSASPMASEQAAAGLYSPRYSENLTLHLLPSIDSRSIEPHNKTLATSALCLQDGACWRSLSAAVPRVASIRIFDRCHDSYSVVVKLFSQDNGGNAAK